MTYIELPFAGSCKLMAFVEDSCSFKEAKALYMDRRVGGRYNEDILDYYMDEYRYKDDICSAAPIMLEVPNEIFAKEPSEWEKAWVNWWSPKAVANQCDFRKQRMFAYTIQPLLFLIGYAMQIIFSVAALLFGARAFTFQPLLHPLTYNVDDKSVHLFRKGSIFLNTKGSYWDTIKYLPFMPVVVIMILLLITGDYTSSMFACIVLELILTLCAVVGVATLVEDRMKKKKLTAIPWFLDEEETSLLVCNGQNKPMTVDRLPSRHKTLRIRFEAFKAQVCRPFSQ